MGTSKDISLFRNFIFPTDGEYAGGLMAQSLAGLGRELKKTKAQVQKIASRESYLAGATGSSISSELPQAVERQSQGSAPPQDLYSIRLINHAPEPVQLPTLEEYPRPSSFLSPPSGYALKKNSGKRVVFTLAQKEIMISFYNRQASTSWWSTYHQKRKRSLNTAVDEARTRQSSTHIPSQQPVSIPTSTSTTQTSTVASSFHTTAIHVPSTTVAVVPTTQSPFVSAPSSSIRSTSSAGVPVAPTSQPPIVSVPSSSIPSTSSAGVPVAVTSQPPIVSTPSRSIPSSSSAGVPVALTSQPPIVSAPTSSIPSTSSAGVPVAVTSQPPIVSTPSRSIPSSSSAGVPIALTSQPPIVSAPTSSIPSTSSAGVPVAPTTQPPLVSASSSSIPSTCSAGVPVVQTTQPALVGASSSSVPSANSTSVPNTALIGQLTGTSYPGLPDIVQWIFPVNFSQSTLGGSGSNACTFIALCFGHLYSHHKFPAPQGYMLSEQWMLALHEAMTKGNEIHDKLFENEAIDVAVEDAVDMAGTECGVQSLGQNYDLFGFDCHNQLEEVFESLTSPPVLHPKCSVVVTGRKSVLFIVNADGSSMIVDSHRHGSAEAFIAYCAPGKSGTLAKWLVACNTSDLLAARPKILFCCSCVLYFFLKTTVYQEITR